MVNVAFPLAIVVPRFLPPERGGGLWLAENQTSRRTGGANARFVCDAVSDDIEKDQMLRTKALNNSTKR
jgi:hypothetical protein